jgi:hypothetical protein
VKRELWLAWSLLAAQVALIGLFLGLEVASVESLAVALHSLSQLVLRGLALLAYPAMGLIILSRRPGHRIGWLFVLANLGWAVNNAAGAYARYGLEVHPGALPGARWAVCLWTWPGYFSVLLLGSLFLYFPDGRLPSPRWRPLVWLMAVWTFFAVLTTAFAAGPVDNTIGFVVNNPLGVGGALGAVLALIGGLQQPLVLFVYAGVAVAMVARWRRAAGLERQQLKWFASAVALLPLLLVAQLAVMVYYGSFEGLPVWASWVGTLPLIAGGAMPVAAAVAILRYRLYEIDVLIRRTLIYSVVTAALAIAYGGSVILLQRVFGATTGESSSQLATVISTLAIAALFTPVRTRVQRWVDKRFYRRKYDAGRAVAAFGTAVRAEVNLEQLTSRLTDLVEDTLQPAHIGLWLRRDNRPRETIKSNSLSNGW